MEYTEKVIKESLRLYPPVPSFSRIALEDHLIGSHPVSRNMTLIISPYVTHRLAQHWDNPYEFDPDRFGKERSDGRSPFAYIPFAAGPRSCIGSNLALMVSKLVIALIMQRYDLTLVPGQSMEPQISTVMWPKYGMNVNVNRLARLNPDSAFTSNEVSMSDKTPSSAL